MKKSQTPELATKRATAPTAPDTANQIECWSLYAHDAPDQMAELVMMREFRDPTLAAAIREHVAATQHLCVVQELIGQMEQGADERAEKADQALQCS